MGGGDIYCIICTVHDLGIGIGIVSSRTKTVHRVIWIPLRIQKVDNHICEKVFDHFHISSVFAFVPPL